ncbi:DUF1639 domain-containing protein [Cinnamomum micranthum f. kanehirae]|uniref:DUF1639 domain-containing protein n=1 Tax=Cinnamomum micranthum f. kanehirae TaxID=337451 RepID=A0A3S3MZ70_9MAGN|nr:DUF1639 domain-containing protein [Cinnamomum micranthum f. kanehirae]
MENEDKNQGSIRGPEAEFFLQWGNRKRLRCVKVREDGVIEKSNGVIRKKATSRIDRRVVTGEKEPPLLHSNGLNRANENRKRQSSSPEKEDRFYTTRGSGLDENGRVVTDGGDERKGFVWPKFYISLSSKEKEEDFIAMKGCKPPQRPKKRAKYIQRSIHRPRGLKAMGSMESDSD